MPEVHGERIIEIDDSASPPFGIAYFSREGAISLLPQGASPATTAQ
jgi:hypothetical protein